MLGFRRRLPLPAVLDHVFTKHREPQPAEDDQRLLLFLPVLAPSPLPPDFCYRPPFANHRPPAHAAYDPSMLSYYGAKGHLNAAVEQAAGLVALSGLRESLCEDLELSEETEVGVALEEGAALGLTHGYLVRAQILTDQEPRFDGEQTRWKTCGEGWQFYSGSNGVGWIFVTFIAV